MYFLFQIVFILLCSTTISVAFKLASHARDDSNAPFEMVANPTACNASSAQL